MEPTPELRTELRLKLGEPSETDGSIFSDDEVDVMLKVSGNILQATVAGWEHKASHFAGLVDVTDGAASRKLGSLLDNAEKMLKYYQRKLAFGPESPSRTRTRVGRIIRHG